MGWLGGRWGGLAGDFRKIEFLALNGKKIDIF
jgi:hypothetical protein